MIVNDDEEPLVSVLMTAYNREKYIAEAIESVLSSTYTNFELIIVDDCSLDNTVKIARRYEVQDKRIKIYINEQNLGDYPNRNKAASFVNGKYMTYVDSDDMLYPNSLEIMVKAYRQYPDAALLMSLRELDESLETFQYLSPQESYVLHFKGNGFLETGPLGVLIKKDAFETVGGFSGKRMIGDTELWLKISAKYPIVRLQKGIAFWRQHVGQEFNQGRKYYLVDALKMYKDALLNDESPLGREEGKKLFENIKKNKLHNLLKYFIKTLNLVECLTYYRAIQSI